MPVFLVRPGSLRRTAATAGGRRSVQYRGGLALVLAGAALLAGCSGSDEPPPEPTTAATRTATATPTSAPLTATPSPTPDPQVAEVDEVLKAIQDMLAFAAELRRLLSQERVEAAYERCNELEDGRSPFGFAPLTNSDLWPRPYVDLDVNAAAACLMLYDLQENVGDPDITVPEWRAAALAGAQAIRQSEDDLPDYSDAQLRRAIEDRQ